MKIARRLAVVSSNVKSLGYDADVFCMEVEFSRGDIYQYEGVEPLKFCLLLNAPSIGKYFNEHYAKWPQQKKVR